MSIDSIHTAVVAVVEYSDTALLELEVDEFPSSRPVEYSAFKPVVELTEERATSLATNYFSIE